MTRRIALLSLPWLVLSCSQSGNSAGSPASTEPTTPELSVAKSLGATGDHVTPGTSGRVAEAPSTPQTLKVSLRDVGLDARAMDRSVDACTDFYQFACGGWVKSATIPAGTDQWSRFGELRQRNHRVLRRILERAAKHRVSGDPVSASLGAFYQSCMNTAAVEQAGTTGLTPLLEVIDKAKNPKTVTVALARLHRHGIWAVFSVTVAPDFKQPARNIVHLHESGLGLPQRDYYLPGKTRYDQHSAGYRAHVQAMLELSGLGAAAARRGAADVWTIESRLAQASKTEVERRDLAKLYHRLDRPGLARLARKLAWKTYFRELGRADIEGISVTSPSFFSRVDNLLGSVPARAWRSYLRWQLLRHSAHLLPQKLAQHAAKLDRMVGKRAPKTPRWQRCVAETSEAMPNYVAQAFVARELKGKSKRYAQRLVRAIGGALGRRLDKLDWMSESTRDEAKAKRAKLGYHVGHPARYDSDDISVDANAFTANALRARARRMRHELARANKANAAHWLLPPFAVDASYDPLHNRLTLPAGILQPPFFSAKHSTPVNLGGMGMLAGHELIHGFDDAGARFDKDGKLRRWWKRADTRKFSSQSRCVVKQFDRYSPLRGERINGRLTLGENLADLGGIRLAFDAHRELAKTARRRYVADGFDDDQQFFLSVAQAWCTKTRPGALRARLLSDPRAPARFRVNGALSNLREFADAFRCKAGSKMRRSRTCRIW